jgi:hypothetical protein
VLPTAPPAIRQLSNLSQRAAHTRPAPDGPRSQASIDGLQNDHSRSVLLQGALQPPKTKNAYRQVDVCMTPGEMLKTFVGERRSGLIFRNHHGRPLSQTNVLRRSLHPILKELGAAKTGFHAMRGFRPTWLRKQRAPEDLIRFWLGHAEQCMTDAYSKLAEDVEFRIQVAETAGTGFAVPTTMRPMRRRKSQQAVLGVAA